MKAIVAVYHTRDNNIWGIGADGTQPLVLKVDRQFFRNTTKGHSVIVGYRTFLDFPNQQPLPNRRNIVLTRQNIQIPGAEVVHDIQQLEAPQYKDAFVIGGARVYEQLLHLCDEVFITHVYQDITPDVFFPNLEKTNERNSVIIETGKEDGIDYQIEHYTRKD